MGRRNCPRFSRRRMAARAACSRLPRNHGEWRDHLRAWKVHRGDSGQIAAPRPRVILGFAPRPRDWGRKRISRNAPPTEAQTNWLKTAEEIKTIEDRLATPEFARDKRFVGR